MGLTPPTQGWDNWPNPAVITDSDDIERIHKHRNKLSHMGKEKIENFNTEFKDLSDVSMRKQELAIYLD